MTQLERARRWHVEMYSVEDTEAKASHNTLQIEKAIIEAEAEGWRRCQKEIAAMIDKSVDYWVTYGPSQAYKNELNYETVVSVLRGLHGDIVAAIEKKENA